VSNTTLEKPTKERRETLRLVTFNRGDHAHYDDLFKILTDVPGTNLPVDFAALCEMYNPKLKPILKKLEDHGFQVYYGNLQGARGNPIVWNPERLKRQDVFCNRLLPAANRAGKYNMQKNLNGGRFLFKPAHRSIIGASQHAIQTSSQGSRHAAALHMNHEILQILNKRKIPTFVGGDFNTVPKDELLRPFREANWRCSQIVGKELDTFGNRAIDMWWWDDKDGDKVARFLRQYTRDGDSDHKALYAEFDILVRS